jgi:hypothetical protein
VTIAPREAPVGAAVPEDVGAFLDGLDGPTLLRWRGLTPGRCRVVAGLLHGNEPSGLRAIHAALREGRPPAVDTWLFIGAVAAARSEPRFSCRQLPGGADLNRCFGPPFAGPEGAVARQVLDVLRPARPEAVLDLHNNTGHNPAYGVVTDIDGPRLVLTGLFAPRIVHSSLRLRTFAEAWDGICPAATIECGQAGTAQADATALAGLRRFLHLPALEAAPVGERPMEVFVSSVRVKLRSGLGLAFAPAPAREVALTLDPELDRHNFQVLPAGTPLGWVAAGVDWPIEAHDETGRECSREYFALAEGRLCAGRSFVPIMMTTNAQVAVTDCLFYATTRRT